MHKIFISLLLTCITAVLISVEGMSQNNAAVDAIYTPASAYKFAAADIRTLPKEYQYDYRYISLYNMDAKSRKELAVTVSFAINSVSRRKKITIPVFVPNTDQTLIRVYLPDYDIDPKDFDKLLKLGSGPKPHGEPYFHAVQEKVSIPVETVEEYVDEKYETGQRYVNGQPVVAVRRVKKRREIPGKPVRELVVTQAQWLDPQDVATLQATMNTEYPVARADWFITFALLAPRYYDFFKLGNKEQDFEKLLFADDNLAAKARSQDKAVVVKSKVALNNRTLTRSPTFTDGYYWKTRDSLRSTNERDYLRQLLDEKADAAEIIGTLPNGLQAYFVSNGAGERQDKADNEIAKDYSNKDAIVRVARSCITCHGVGINPIDDEVRSLTAKFSDKEQLQLLIVDKKDQQRIEDLFSSNLSKRVVRDQQIYTDAVGLCTGLDPTENALRFSSYYDLYNETLLEKEVMARELGITVFDLEVVARNTKEPHVLGIIKEPIRAIRRDQWEVAFPDVMNALIATKKLPSANK